ncbi:MAG: hypothetical protein SFZ23_04235 [Planctomycetota bacterium]|nr:hypothetical protein [Planctomycetota bacterium]
MPQINPGGFNEDEFCSGGGALSILLRLAGMIGAGSAAFVATESNAQVTVGAGAIIEGGDPTPINGPFCATHVMPLNSPVIPLDSGLGLTENPLGTLTPGYSWAAAAPSWAKDRRPLAVFQMSSGDYLNNPRGNVDWWWPQNNGPAEYWPDDGLDLQTPRPLEIGIVRYDLIGNVEDGNQTRVPNGIPDAFDVLIRRIKTHAANGFRRFVLHLPGGTLGVTENGFSTPCNGTSLPIYSNGGTTQSMNQYVAMPQWKREYFTGFVHLNGQPTTQLNAWGEFVRDYVSTSPDTEPDRISLEVYIGGSLSGAGDQLNLATQQTAAVTTPPVWDGGHRPAISFVEWRDSNNCIPRTITYWTESRIPAPITLIPIDPRVESHMRLFWMQIKPWIAAGFRTIWLDAVTANSLTKAQRWGFLELSRNPYLRSQGIRIGGEAFPFSDDGNNFADDCALAVTRWFANSRALYRSCTNRTLRVDLTALNRRFTSEVHYLSDCSPGPSWNDYLEVRKRGYVLSFYTPAGPDGKVKVEEAKRWYSMGKIQVADFDGDGVVTEDDPLSELDGSDHDDAYNVIKPYILNPSHPQPAVRVFATGDIDGNGVVNADDWEFFFSKWNPSNNQRGYAPDYGTPNDL